MKGYILRRILLLIPLLLGISFTTFALAKALPGDPVFSLVGERTRPEIIEKLRRDLGADKGVLRQYAGYLFLLAKGEMGRSYYTNRSVFDDIAAKFPKTLLLAAFAMLIAVPAGLFSGMTAALTAGRAPDRVISAISITFLSLPVFSSGLLLMLLFSLELNLLPPSGSGGLRNMLLPAITLSLPAMATIGRVARVSLLEILGMPFIRTARAKGITGMRINMVHALRNAAIPIVTVTGLDFAGYLNGAVLTETIFGWDGIGRFTMEAIMKRDYPVILGCVFVGTVVFVIVNLLVDIAYHIIDPRVRAYGNDR